MQRRDLVGQVDLEIVFAENPAAGLDLLRDVLRDFAFVKTRGALFDEIFEQLREIRLHELLTNLWDFSVRQEGLREIGSATSTNLCSAALMSF